MEPTIRTTAWKDPSWEPFFYGFVKETKPVCCVQLGVFAGYSAYLIAKALKDNLRGYLWGYDLWEDYPFTHCTMDEAARNLHGLPVCLVKKDADKVHEDYSKEEVDLLMIDISNNGDTFRQYLRDWLPKLKVGAVVMMEGGSEERDNIDWMIRYSKPAIVPALSDKFITRHYSQSLIPTFPSLTLFKRER